MKTEAQKSNYIAKTRNLAKTLIEFKAAKSEYDATGAGGIIIDADFTGINEGLLASDMTAFQNVINSICKVIDGGVVDDTTNIGVLTVIETYKNV